MTFTELLDWYVMAKIAVTCGDAFHPGAHDDLEDAKKALNDHMAEYAVWRGIRRSAGISA